MDLSRAVYSRDLKIAAVRALDSGATNSEIARKYQASPKLQRCWRGEWRGKASFFPESADAASLAAAVDDARRIGESERKISELTMENDFLKKYCNISGIITRQPSSMAAMPV